MSTVRDCVEINPAVMICGETYKIMSDRELGRLWRRINAAYQDGDVAFLNSLPCVGKVYPRRRPTLRRRLIPIAVRRDVLGSGPCVTCGTAEQLTIDHKLALSRGGTDDRSNLQPMCKPCNSRKGAR